MIGIAIVRMNPMHLGHKYLIEEMLKVSDVVCIGLGSCQEERTLKNPFNPKEREQMIRNIFPDKNKVKIFFLEDDLTLTKKEWQEYCLNELKKQTKEDLNPNKYFAGCENDMTWWENAVNLNNYKMELISLCRYENNYLSATEIRKSLRHYLEGDTNSTEWILETPKENLEFVKNNYPKELISKKKSRIK